MIAIAEPSRAKHSTRCTSSYHWLHWSVPVAVQIARAELQSTRHKRRHASQHRSKLLISLAMSRNRPVRHIKCTHKKTRLRLRSSLEDTLGIRCNYGVSLETSVGRAQCRVDHPARGAESHTVKSRST